MKLEAKIKDIKHHLSKLTDYAISYFKALKKKYGKGRARKTEIKTFESIDATKVVVASKKLYVNREEGFIGTAMRKDEFVCDCSDLDNVIAFRRDGKFMVTAVADKTFVGKDIIHAAIWKKSDEHMVYNYVYKDIRTNWFYVKRFSITSAIKDRIYSLTKNDDKSTAQLAFRQVAFSARDIFVDG